MNILALDASANACSVALLTASSIQFRESFTPRSHAQQMLPMVDQLVSSANMSLAEIDAVAFGAGPGSFTGLRIALGFAQGLGFGLSVPLVPVDSLHACAHASLLAATQTLPRLIISVLDARMGEVYWAGFSRANGELVNVTAARLQNIAEAQHSIQQEFDLADSWIIGPGAGLLDKLHSFCKRVDASVEPHARSVASLALPLFVAGHQVCAEQAELNYLRNSVSWNKRTRIRSRDSH